MTVYSKCESDTLPTMLPQHVLAGTHQRASEIGVALPFWFFLKQLENQFGFVNCEANFFFSVLVYHFFLFQIQKLEENWLGC